MSNFDFTFLHEKKKKKDEFIPLYQELDIPERLPPKEEKLEESRVTIIQL